MKDLSNNKSLFILDQSILSMSIVYSLNIIRYFKGNSFIVQDNRAMGKKGLSVEEKGISNAFFPVEFKKYLKILVMHLFLGGERILDCILY